MTSTTTRITRKEKEMTTYRFVQHQNCKIRLLTYLLHYCVSSVSPFTIQQCFHPSICEQTFSGALPAVFSPVTMSMFCRSLYQRCFLYLLYYQCLHRSLCQQCFHHTVKNFRRFYGKITGNQLPVHFPLFFTGARKHFQESGTER